MRWKFLKPAVAQKYKRLCSAHVPLSSYLLGDDLDKQLKSINEWKGIGVQMTHEQSRKRFHEKSFQQPSTRNVSYGARSSSQSFLYKQRSHRPKYKKEARTKSYNSNNYNTNNKIKEIQKKELANLKNTIENFKAGSISLHFSNWLKIDIVEKWLFN